MTAKLHESRMKSLIRKYFDGGNDADKEKIESCFVAEAIHYFPPGTYDAPF